MAPKSEWSPAHGTALDLQDHDAAAHCGMAWSRLIKNMIPKKPRTTLTCSRSWGMSRPAAAGEKGEAHLAIVS